MSSPLPYRILGQVAECVQTNRRPDTIVPAVQHMLRESFRPIHRAMSSSKLISLRKNAKNLRALYIDGGLASRLMQAANDGNKDNQTRVEEISRITLDRLKHILGLLGGVDEPEAKVLYERLVRMVTVKAEQRQSLATLSTNQAAAA